MLFPAPRDLPHPGIKPRSPELQADSLPFEPPVRTHENDILHFFPKEESETQRGKGQIGTHLFSRHTDPFLPSACPGNLRGNQARSLMIFSNPCPFHSVVCEGETLLGTSIFREVFLLAIFSSILIVSSEMFVHYFLIFIVIHTQCKNLECAETEISQSQD